MKGDSDEREIEILSDKLMQTGSVINKDDLTMAQLERKIRQLEQELTKERKINEENRQEMVVLEKDI